MTETAGLYEALAAAQAEIKNPEKTIPVKFSGREYKYADLADVLTAILPVFSKHGLSVSQPTRIADDQLIVETVIAHKSGQTVTSVYPVCAINNDHQKMGAAMTYARRYAICSIVGVAAEDDTDGQGAAKAGGSKKMSVHAAKKEINWDNIVSSIRTAKTEKLLDNMAVRVLESEGIWPDSYVTNAREEIEARRKELLADAPQENGADPDIQQWDEYDTKIAALADVLKGATREIQGEIWDAEMISERFAAGLIFPPDHDKLKAMIKDD